MVLDATTRNEQNRFYIDALRASLIGASSVFFLEDMTEN
jgi:hypothetical protein